MPHSSGGGSSSGGSHGGSSGPHISHNRYAGSHRYARYKSDGNIEYSYCDTDISRQPKGINFFGIIIAIPFIFFSGIIFLQGLIPPDKIDTSSYESTVFVSDGCDVIDNEVYQKSKLNIDPKKIVHARCMDMNDRSLRSIRIKINDKHSYNTRFDITAACELMTIFCLAKDKDVYIDFKNWSENDRENRDPYKLKSYNKLELVHGKKVFIINVLSSELNIHESDNIVEISSLFKYKNGKYYELGLSMHSIVKKIMEACRHGN